MTYNGFTPEARAAFQYAVDIWASFIQTSVPIKIDATFEDLGGVEGGFLTLGSAGPTYRVIPPGYNVWMVSALGDAIAGTDIATGEADIEANFNSNADWYYGTDGNIPTGEWDFVTIALHEIAHGLGFISKAQVEEVGGVTVGKLRIPLTNSIKAPTFYIYNMFVVNGSGAGITSFEDPSAALFAQFTSNNLFWDGAEGKEANGGNRPKLYVPAPWDPGSSYDHLDEDTFPAGTPNSLMTPFTTRSEANHHPGPITLGMFEDIGWVINKAPMFATDTISRSVAENTVAGVNIGSPVAATDTGDTLTYTLEGDDAASFSIESTTGQLKTKAALNHETQKGYKVRVAASDGRLRGTIEVTIDVTDVNDAPVFATDSTQRAIPRGTPAGQNIGTPVSATDEDGDTLRYSLGGDPDAASFGIDSTTGQLLTSAPLTPGDKDAYQVRVEASDGNGGIDTIDVTIDVTQGNEAPVFADGDNTIRSIAENTAANQNIGTAVTATDPDAPNPTDDTNPDTPTLDTLTYTLKGTDMSSFSIDADTGQLKTKASLNYEAKASYQVTVEVSDGALTDVITVSISVTDVNDAPVFASQTARRAIAENTVANQNIGLPVLATDEDGDTLTYTLSGDPDAASFDMDRSNAQLRTKAALNYEDKDAYQVRIEASDGNSGTATIAVTIVVTDENEAPIFASDSTTRSVAENTPANQNIGSAVSATDEDTSNTLRYTLSGDPDAASFDIDADTGQLKTKAALNYETKVLYRVTVKADDNKGGIDTIAVTIVVTNANDAPIFASDSTTRSVAENTPANQNIGSAVSATDEDTSDTLRYTLSGDPDAASFDIDTRTGQLKTKAALNYETENEYKVTVGVSDGKGGTDTIAVTINVTDANDAPVFASDTTTRSVAEGTSANQNIGLPVSATDEDRDTLRYTLSGTDAASFNIDTRTGQLKTKAALNYENKNAYQVMIEVSDGNSGTDTLTVMILITDVNDAPVFTEGDSTTRGIAENTPANENIGAPVSATDEDGNTLTYSLGGTDASSFDIDTGTGQLKTKAALNLETTAQYRVTVSVDDGNSGTDTIDVTINVTQGNDAPVFTEGTSTTRSIAENTAVNRNIGAAVTATDPDAPNPTDDTNPDTPTPDTLRYTLKGTDMSSFSIDADTGQLKTKASLNYEAKASYQVTVEVSDGALTDVITVSISVTDVNDAPVFTEGDNTTRGIAENTPANQNIGVPVSATDEDGDTLTYTLGGTDAAAFNLMPSGQLRTKVPLNHEEKDSYQVRIEVSDGNGGTDTIAVSISVTDVNDAPVFADDTISRSVAENTPTDQNIGLAVTATDEDGDALTYSLDGTDALSFGIDRNTGQLKTKASLNYETEASYQVSIEVNDSNGGTDTVTVGITVTDENDAPVFASETTTRSIIGNTPANENIGLPVSATDEDGDTLTYSLGGDPDAASFGIDPTTGQLLTSARLNPADKDAYQVTVEASDGNGGSDSITVTINVTDTGIVVFTDRNLETAVKRALGIGSGDPVLESALLTLTALTVTRRQIVSLTGLEGAKDLKHLDLGDNAIVDLTPLEDLRRLEQLDLDDNQIVTLTPLQGLGSLKNLDLDDNLIEDISALSRLGHLQTLDLRDNNVMDVTPLSTMTHLTHLYLQGNANLTNIKQLVKLTSTTVDIRLPEPVEVPDVNLAAALRTTLGLLADDPIFPEDMEQLTDLTVSGRSIADLTGLETATRLTSLTLANNAIENLSPLSNLRLLQTLDLSDNAIETLTPLKDLSSLTMLNLSNNAITDVLPLAGLTRLTDLDLTGNTGITNPEVLFRLQEGGTTITGVEVPDFVAFSDTALEAAVRNALRLSEHLPILPTNMQQRLTTLTVSRKGVTELTGLQAATGLTRLTLSYNAITDVSPLRPLEKLTTLDLRNNEITDVLPLAELTTLTSLTLTGNPVSNPGVLFGLKQGGTRITGVTIPDAVAFPDTALEGAVRTALTLSSTEPILPHVLAGLTNLSASGLGIVDLTGLEHATGLTDLTLSDNDIIDVLPLAGLTSLTSLTLTGNPVSNPGVLYPLQQTGTTITGVTIPTSVVFPDTALDTAVRSALRISAGDTILPDALAMLTRLTAARKGITDLTGLEHATGLERLDLGQNEITNISALANLIRLENLDLANNGVTTISALSNLKRLEVLDLRYNDVTDTALLSTMTHLKNLYVRGNEKLSSLKQLVRLTEAGTRVDITLPRPVTFRDDNLKSALRTALDALPTLTLLPDDPIFPEDMEMLITFTAPNQSIVNLTGLETATNLTTLTLSNNQIVSLSPLSRLTRLTDLDLATNQISSISSLSGLTHLTILNLSDNRISSVSSLSRLTRLTDMDLSNNQISSVSSLSGLTRLTELLLLNNRIRDVLPLQGLSSLDTLNLSGNTDLTTEKAEVLYKLLQGGTRITFPAGITLPVLTNIVVFNNTALETAVRSALRISRGYPILKTKITELERLTATRKEIADLTGLEQAKELTTLDLGDNAIETLTPLKDLAKLTTLDLADNDIVDLSSLQNLAALTNLNLADNEIENVTALSGLTNLKTLDLRNNGVIDVAPLRDLVSLTRIYLRGNENLENLEWLGALENLRSDIRLPDVVRLPNTNLDREVRDALRTAGQTVSDTLPMSEELLESLTMLTASSRNITDLTGCEHMTALTTLDLSNNQITDVSPLSRLYSLETLMLDENPILDTSVLRELERRGTEIDITIYRYPSWDVNQDGRVNEADVFLITATITGESPDVNGDGNVDVDDETAADANKDGNVDTDDLLLVFEKFDRPVNLAAPLLSVESVELDWRLLERIDADRLRVQLEILRAENDGSLKYRQAIAFLQAVLVALHPNQTLLLANYPNPFNPETWIPYQLARGSHVWITIYDTRGAVVRRLELGYRAEGYYRVRGRAAHWDGRNTVGERVASGLYFYQLETDAVSLLRRMVILK